MNENLEKISPLQLFACKQLKRVRRSGEEGFVTPTPQLKGTNRNRSHIRIFKLKPKRVHINVDLIESSDIRHSVDLNPKHIAPDYVCVFNAQDTPTLSVILALVAGIHVRAVPFAHGLPGQAR